jgi:hypothetical protein
LLKENEMKKSVIKSSYQVAITALSSLISTITLHVLFAGLQPVVIAIVGGVVGYIASSFIIEACNSYNLFQFMKSSTTNSLEAPVEALKAKDVQVDQVEAAAPVEAAKPVEEPVVAAAVVASTEPVQEKKPEPVAPVANRIVMKKKAPK